MTLLTRVTRAGLGVAVLVLAGCGSSVAQDQVDADVAPAQAYLDLVLGRSAEQAAAQAVQTEEAIAACMAEQGFEYLPDTSGYHHVVAAEVDPPPGSREFAESYGYGYTDAPDAMRIEGRTGDNANDALVAAMSPDEMAQYMTALWGSLDDPDRDPDAPYDWRTAGCSGVAQHEVGSGGAVTDETTEALTDEVERIEERALPADERVVDVDARWAACMGDAGHVGFERRSDAEAAWVERWSAIQVDHGERGWEVLPDGTVVGEDAVAQEEQALATADWVCGDEVGYDAVVADVRAELQQEYVDAHRDELDAWAEEWAAPDRDG